MNSKQFPQFNLMLLCVGLLVIGICQSAVIDQTSEIETIDDGQGHNITLNINHTLAGGEEEDVIEVTDANGHKVIEVDIFDRYYIDKPANSTDCLLTPKTENVNGSETCYNRTRHPGINLMDAIVKECKGRDIFLQIPCDPDVSIDVENGTEPSADRRKRNVLCEITFYVTIRRIYYCCRIYLGVCRSNCVRYKVVKFRIVRC